MPWEGCDKCKPLQKKRCHNWSLSDKRNKLDWCKKMQKALKKVTASQREVPLSGNFLEDLAAKRAFKIKFGHNINRPSKYHEVDDSYT